MYILLRNISAEAQAGIKAQKTADIKIRVEISLLLVKAPKILFASSSLPTSGGLWQEPQCVYRLTMLIGWLVVLKSKYLFFSNRLANLLG